MLLGLNDYRGERQPEGCASKYRFGNFYHLFAFGPDQSLKTCSTKKRVILLPRRLDLRLFHIFLILI